MKVLASTDTVRVESDDENADPAHANVLLDIFSEYQLDVAKPGDVIEIDLDTPIGRIRYFVHEVVRQ